jgi:hypothetical protein
MTSPQLAALCEKWQDRIRYLRGWRITAKFVTAKQLPGKYYGQNKYDRDAMTAEIIILRPCDMRKRFQHAPIEATLVHELGHILMPDITDENKEGIEASIDKWAEVLMTAYQEGE